MNFDRLAAILPKRYQDWTVQDVLTWLSFISLDKCHDSFQENCIDGVALTLLTDQDLQQHLLVEQPLLRKKILHWQSTLLQQYNQYLQEHKQETKTVTWQLDQDKEQRQREKEEKERRDKEEREQRERQERESKVTPKVNPNCNFFDDDMDDFSLDDMKIEQEEEQQASSPMEEEEEVQVLSIEPVEEANILSKGVVKIEKEGASLGRHQTNTIPVHEQSVSRYHARILYQENQFRIQDLGSSRGTFIKLQKEKHLQDGDIFEIGNNQFHFHVSDQGVVLEVGQGQMHHYEIVFSDLEAHNRERIQDSKHSLIRTTEQEIRIGRKHHQNHINIIEDRHISNQHALIRRHSTVYFLTDLESSNGIWLKVPVDSSVPLPIDSLFKLGNYSQYKVIGLSCMTRPRRLHQTLSDQCVICCVSPKDTLVFPCKHDQFCEACIKKTQQCAICLTPIKEHLKIYK